MLTFKIIDSFDDSYLRFVFRHFEGIDLNPEGCYDLHVCWGDTFSVIKENRSIAVAVFRKSQLFYALSLIIANIQKESFRFIKNTPFRSLNFMCDCSRAAVLNIPTIKKLVVYLAKLGFTGLELYTEDTYEITDEPYFGHLRGRFTHAELKELDSYTKKYGIELIPCIQTLAHLDNIFLWPRYENIHDLWDCLLIGNEESYELIEKMFKSAAECFSSRTINIGYDEAYHAGRGKYLDQHGPSDQTELLFEHLIKVAAIAAKYGFNCVVYSDMFFNHKSCLQRADLPRNLTFNYWNYYSTNKRVYDRNFDRHLDLLPSVNFTAGAWKWLGPAPFNKYGMLRLRPGIVSAAEHQVQTLTLSAWGDNGNECPLFSIIPQMVYFSLLSYIQKPSKEDLQQLSATVFGADFNDLLKLDIANGHRNQNGRVLTNPAKYLLYNDPLCGIMDYHTDASYCQYYKKCVGVLKNRVRRNKEWSYLFDLQIALCDYLSVKANMGNELYHLYQSHDLEGLRVYGQVIVPKAIKKLNTLIRVARTAWYTENKTFGFDVIEHRLGGQMQRLYEIQYRIESYLSGDMEKVEEWEQQKLPCNYANEKGLVYKHNAKYVLSPYYPAV